MTGRIPAPSLWLEDGARVEGITVDRWVDAFTGDLADAGVGCGDAVALIGRESPEAMCVILALWRLGAVACPLPRRLPEAAIASMMARLEPKLLVVEEEWSALAAKHPGPRAMVQAGEHGPRLTFSAETNPAAAGAPRFPKNRAQAPEAIAALLFTSGSTAQPKLAALSLGAFLANAQASAALLPLGPHDAWCANLPLHHVGGLSVIVRTGLAGASLAFPKQGEPIPQRATHLSVVSAQLVQWSRDPKLRSRLLSLKAVLLGGGPVPVELCTALAGEGVPLFASYGLTETASQLATSAFHEEGGAWRGAFPLPGCVVRIGERDEIFVKTPALFSGYLGPAGLTSPVDREGFFPTGDRGRLTAEGRLQVFGRLDHLIISGGENLQPEEVEQALRRIFPLAEAVVSAIPHPVWGQRPVAFLLWKDEGVALPGSELRRLLREHLPPFKIPDYFYQWPTDGECRTPNGKIRRPFFASLALRLHGQASESTHPGDPT